MTDDLRTLDPPESLHGWELDTSQPHRLVWRSESDYGIKVELPDASVRGLLPPLQISTDDGQPSLQEAKSIHPGTGDAQEAVDIAVSWLENHPLDVNDVVRDLPGLGDRTIEYLALRHGVTHLYQVRREYNRGVLKEIVQERFHDDLEDQLEPAEVSLDDVSDVSE
jgi:hypothetical protein